MNVYDFDKTIFYPDSSVTFCLYCLRRYPRILFPSMLKGLWGFARTALHLGTLSPGLVSAPVPPVGPDYLCFPGI